MRSCLDGEVRLRPIGVIVLETVAAVRDPQHDTLNPGQVHIDKLGQCAGTKNAAAPEYPVAITQHLEFGAALASGLVVDTYGRREACRRAARLNRQHPRRMCPEAVRENLPVQRQRMVLDGVVDGRCAPPLRRFAQIERGQGNLRRAIRVHRGESR